MATGAEKLSGRVNEVSKRVVFEKCFLKGILGKDLDP
jgi:hypothetical protein